MSTESIILLALVIAAVAVAAWQLRTPGAGQGDFGGGS